MNATIFRHTQFSFFCSAKSSVLVMQIALGVVSAIAAPGFLNPAAAQLVPQPTQTSASQQSGAAQLGGVVRVNCFQVQSMPVPPQDCQFVVEGGPILDRQTIRDAENSVNNYPRHYADGQADGPTAQFGFVVPVPELF
jgi:hypothetical protein